MAMEVTCPHCNQVFDLDEDKADRIRQQVRNEAFEKELSERIALFKKSSEADTASQVSAAIMKEREKYEKLLSEEKERSSKSQSDLKEARTKLEAEHANRKLEIDKARSDAEKNLREEYTKQLDEAKGETAKIRSELQEANYNLASANKNHAIEIEKAKLEVKDEYTTKISDLEAEKRAAEEQRDFYKDLKARMSTKMVGETLEKHCAIEFNKIRALAFPNAYFDKDNTVSKASNSKGDYIFREIDKETGAEIISIMFEMKNEMDETATKKTNASFFRELDKDRREKNCEYAVLVSLLEADNELYNQGIVDVSYEYEKMYVIRPQFFIPLISILRNAAMNALDSKKELVRVQNQNVDITNFESSLMKFKNEFSYNYEQASKRFNEAIDEIDKTIDHLNKVKEALLKSDRQLRLANDKVDNVTIKRLTANSPTMREEFAKLADSSSDS